MRMPVASPLFHRRIFRRRAFRVLCLIALTGALCAFPISQALAGIGPKLSAKPASGMPAPKNGTKTEDKTDDTNLPAGVVEYNKGVELFQIAQVQNEKGNASGQKQLLKEAIRHFGEALKQNPGLTDAQSNIGFAYLTLRDYRKAIAAFEKALVINPQHLNTLNGLATAYAFHNEIDRSIRTFDRLTTLDPGNSQYFFNKGSVLQRARKIEEARKAYEQALRISPDDQRALFNMGTLYENQGKLAEARTFYEKAKSVEIGNTIGLEAIHRMEAIDATMNSENGPAKPESGKPDRKRGLQGRRSTK